MSKKDPAKRPLPLADNDPRLRVRALRELGVRDMTEEQQVDAFMRAFHPEHIKEHAG